MASMLSIHDFDNHTQLLPADHAAGSKDLNSCCLRWWLVLGSLLVVNGSKRPIADSDEPAAVNGCFTKPFRCILPLP